VAPLRGATIVLDWLSRPQLGQNRAASGSWPRQAEHRRCMSSSAISAQHSEREKADATGGLGECSQRARVGQF
jgi:hypothetical protein